MAANPLASLLQRKAPDTSYITRGMGEASNRRNLDLKELATKLQHQAQMAQLKQQKQLAMLDAQQKHAQMQERKAAGEKEFLINTLKLDLQKKDLERKNQEAKKRNFFDEVKFGLDVSKQKQLVAHREKTLAAQEKARQTRADEKTNKPLSDNALKDMEVALATKYPIFGKDHINKMIGFNPKLTQERMVVQETLNRIWGDIRPQLGSSVTDAQAQKIVLEKTIEELRQKGLIVNEGDYEEFGTKDDMLAKQEQETTTPELPPGITREKVALVKERVDALTKNFSSLSKSEQELVIQAKTWLKEIGSN